MSYDCSFSMRYLFFIYRLYTKLYHASLVILSGINQCNRTVDKTCLRVSIYARCCREFR